MTSPRITALSLPATCGPNSTACSVFQLPTRQRTAHKPMGTRAFLPPVEGFPQGPHWMDELPLVLLGVRTAWREDPGCSASDLVYGTSLCIPGEFLPHEPRDLRVSSEFLHQLQDNMRMVLPPTHEFHGGLSAYKPDNLASTGWVYVCHDAHRSPLQRPYDGPFKILETHEKYYVLDMNGHQDSVSIDGLKTAYGKQANCQPFPVTPRTVPPPHSIQVAPFQPTTAAPQPTLARAGRSSCPSATSRPWSSRCPSLEGALWGTTSELTITL